MGTIPYQVATEAGLWGPALLLATAVSADGRAFQEAAVTMALSLLLPGTPMRTLALVLAGRPDLVHVVPEGVAAAVEAPTTSSTTAVTPTKTPNAGGVSGFGGFTPVASPQTPPAGFYNPLATSGGRHMTCSGGGATTDVAAAINPGGGMLASWREHLVVLLTARGPVDSSEAVVRLGDRLRVEASQVLEL